MSKSLVPGPAGHEDHMHSEDTGGDEHPHDQSMHIEDCQEMHNIFSMQECT